MLSDADVTFHPSWWHKYAGVDFDRRFFFDAPFRVERDRDMRRALWELFGEYGLGEEDPKPRPILFSDLIASGFLYSELLGCEVKYSPSDAPQVLCAEMSDEDALSLKPPSLDEGALWRDVEKQISYLEERFSSVISAINLQGVQNIAMDLRGQQLFMDYYDDPDIARSLLSAAADLSLDIGKRLYSVSDRVSGGVTSIVNRVRPHVYLTSNCSVTMISEKMYREYLLEYDAQLSRAFPDFGIHHCGNNMESVIEGYLEVPNLTFLEIGAGSDLSRVARAVQSSAHRDAVCCVRYSPVKLKTADAAQVKKDTEEAVRAFGSDEKLCFSCVGIDESVPHGNVKQYLSVFRP